MILLNPLPDRNMTSLDLAETKHGFSNVSCRQTLEYYKYNARPIYDEDVLFLVLDILEIGHL